MADRPGSSTFHDSEGLLRDASPKLVSSYQVLSTCRQTYRYTG